MTRTAADASTPSFPAVPPPPMHLPVREPVPDLAGEIDELLRLEGCTVSILRATLRRGELGDGPGAMLAALEAEAMHRLRALTDLANQYGGAAAARSADQAPLPPALASASTSLASAAFVVVALTVAGYRRLEDLASRSGDLEALRFAVTAIAEVGGAARQISREIGRAGAGA